MGNIETTQAIARSALEKPQYLDLIQTDPKEFNDHQKIKREEFKKANGENAYCDIMWGGKHHPLRASRSVDYKLTDSEIKSLCIEGILYKQPKDEVSFARQYLNLYNNDMPVFVTSDSILYAYHKLYDNYLMMLETNLFINKLVTLCKSLLDTLYTITPTEQNTNYLRDLEVFFMVPYIILQLQNGISETIVTEPKLLFTVEELKELLVEPTKERIAEELAQGYKRGSSWNLSYTQIRWLLECIFPNENFDSYESAKHYYKYFGESPKLFAAHKAFERANYNGKIEFKFGGRNLFDSFIKSIATKSDLAFDFCGNTIKMDGSQFTPRGHYTKSTKLQLYFLAFTWLSKFVVSIDRDENITNAIALASVFSKIGENSLELINDFQRFISKIIGEPDNYTTSEFLNLVNPFLPNPTDLNDSINWIISNKNSLAEKVLSCDLKKCTLTKFGDTDQDKTSIAFSLIGKANNIDNIVIQQMVDEKLVDDDGKIPMRKFPSVFDVVYTLFDNEAAKDYLDYRMCNSDVCGRDGISYHKHLDEMRSKLSTHEFTSTIYSQNLKMLRALVQDREIKNVFPFNTRSWGHKQANCQVGNYAELRHDNVLYLEEAGGCCLCCEHPDIMIEPVPTFWKEMLVGVKMLKDLVGDLKVPDRRQGQLCEPREVKVLNNFEMIIGKFLQFNEQYLNNGTVNDELVTELKCIIEENDGGSGPPSYRGWYMTLYTDSDVAFEKSPEVSSMFTAVGDDRGKGGIVHIGTGMPQMMYINVCDSRNNSNKIFMGPVYKSYEVITEPGERLTDEVWKEKHKEYESLFH